MVWAVRALLQLEGKQDNGAIPVAIFTDTINSVLFSSNCVKVNTDLLSIVYNLFILKCDMFIVYNLFILKTDSCPSAYF